ncbi:outer membrane beta-barrel family protein [Mariniflexile aquimaris]|uniref:Outer membrane beta-barrel family protein n=1 Tax=Mariniflexile aquimaris TaxID=881009 RepID=A0ABW3BT48_9FLAO
MFVFKSINNGNYVINIEDPNFQSFEFEFGVKDDYIFHDIELKPIESLGEVVISAKKTVQFTATGNTLNVEGTELSNKKSAMEVLNYAPTVSTHEGLSVLGSNKVIVKVNNKELIISDQALINYLNNLDPSNIQKIVITDVKMAEMDAETDAFVNIILKKDVGTNIDLNYINLNLADKFTENSGGDISIYHRTNKFRFSTDFYTRRHNHQIIGNETDLFPDKIIYTINRNTPDIKRRELAADLGIDYLLNDKNTISILYNYFYDVALDLNPIEKNIITNSQTLDSILTQKLASSKDLYHTYSAFYERKLDSLESNFVLTTSYAYNTEKSPLNINNQYYKSNTLFDSEELRTDNYTQNQIFSLQADLSKIFLNDNNLNLGIKIVNTKISNNSLTEENISNNWSILDEYSDSFKFSEVITSFYASYNVINKRNAWNFGIRDEYTHNTFTTLEQPDTKSGYNNLIPSINYKRFIENTKVLTLFTNLYIERPSYYYFNPTLSIIDATNQYKGNPDIKAYTNYRTGIQYAYKSKYVSQLSYTYSNDYFFAKPIYDNQTGITTSTYQNEGILSILKFYASLPIKIANWWNIQNKITTSYAKYSLDNQNYEGIRFNINSTNLINFPNGIKLNFNWNYTNPNQNICYDYKENFVANTYIDIPIFNENLKMSFGLNDIFDTSRTNYHYDFLGIEKTIYSKINTHRFIFSISYSFQSGKERDLEQKESIIENEKNRMGKNVE